MVAATPGEDIEALRTAIKGAKEAGLPNYPAGKAKFDEAEKIYRDVDRRDLALSLRAEIDQ